ncbi:ABC transporter ATP-binding protein [Pseudothauera rhizosphaerae]|uniref:ABC transporter ATP-binding protein n=1 Tax=Pseudothauera rhizosphaerae TaxID=2565932 RepID=A0A4S4AU49_9RHOO|nr:ABC transporter ATP-binding protein [Pseudothauera rhizosphaerae]THF62115.1 ABC transporter ATP-binding protein [Pseudothauera rhizosphaerae]
MADLLAIQGLRTWFHTRAGVARAVNDVSFAIQPGETLALVGESGSGKSVTAYSILRLINEPGRIEAGKILFNGTDLLKLDDKGIRSIRGDRVAMIFQEPLSAFNPVQTVGAQIVEAIRLHRRIGRRAAYHRAMELLEQVGIPSPAKRVHEFPHRLSGGMRQRAMIALALACEPDLLIADEPTTALDVTTQAQILKLLKSLQAENGMGLLLITHDLGVVAETADRAAVMYAGRVVEEGLVATLFTRPFHPYTAGLLASVSIDDLPPGARLPEIPGTVPSLLVMPRGCAFAERCPYAAGTDGCLDHAPAFLPVADDHRVACFRTPPTPRPPLHAEATGEAAGALLPLDAAARVVA